MAEIDAEQEARLKRFQLMKRLLVIVPLSTILILFCLCMILGIRLHYVKKELRKLQAQVEAMAVVSEPVDTAGAQTTGSTEAYTSSGVDESRRTGIDTQEDTGEEEGIRKVYLTFDDGPSSNTGRILDILARYDVKATFFVVGKEDEIYQPLYNRIVEEGHTLAMHSYSHKYQEIYRSKESYVEDLTKLQEFLYDTTGVWCRYCRFPGGSSNSVSKVDMHELIEYLDEQDMTYFDWNIVSGDATSDYISSGDIIRNCTRKLGEFDEAIILMHDAAEKDSTVEALPGLIEQIQAMENTRIVPITDDTEPIHHISND